MKYSPDPVADTAADRSSAYVPAPINGESPTRPQRFAVTPAGRSCGSDSAPHIDCHCADRSIFDGIGTSSRSKRFLELPAPFGKNEEVVGDLLDPGGGRKSISGRTDKKDMRAVLHQAARKADRRAGGLEGGNRPCTSVSTIHDGGIEFDLALLGQHAPAPCIEAGIFLEDASGCLNRVDGQAAFSEDRAARFERIAQSGARGCFMSGIMMRDSFRTGAAVHHQAPTSFDHGEGLSHELERAPVDVGAFVYYFDIKF